MYSPSCGLLWHVLQTLDFMVYIPITCRQHIQLIISILKANNSVDPVFLVMRIWAIANRDRRIAAAFLTLNCVSTGANIVRLFLVIVFAAVEMLPQM